MVIQIKRTNSLPLLRDDSKPLRREDVADIQALIASVKSGEKAAAAAMCPLPRRVNIGNSATTPTADTTATTATATATATDNDNATTVAAAAATRNSHYHPPVEDVGRKELLEARTDDNDTNERKAESRSDDASIDYCGKITSGDDSDKRSPAGSQCSGTKSLFYFVPSATGVIEKESCESANTSSTTSTSRITADVANSNDNIQVSTTPTRGSSHSTMANPTDFSVLNPIKQIFVTKHHVSGSNEKNVPFDPLATNKLVGTSTVAVLPSGLKSCITDNETILHIKIKSSIAETVFYVPLTLMIEREMEMKTLAQNFGIAPERWAHSLLFRMYQSCQSTQTKDFNSVILAGDNVKLELNPEQDCTTTNHSHTLRWEPWLTICVRHYYNTGTVRIPNDCTGNDILLALEYFGIVYVPEQLAFDSFAAYLRVKLWSDYYTYRASLAAWVTQRLLKLPSRHSHAFCTSPGVHEEIIYLGLKRAELLDGGLTLDPAKYDEVASCAVLYELFNDDEREVNVVPSEKDVDCLLREDFSSYLSNQLPGTTITFHIKNVIITQANKIEITRQRAVLHVDFRGSPAQQDSVSIQGSLAADSVTKTRTDGTTVKWDNTQPKVSSTSLVATSQTNSVIKQNENLTNKDEPRQGGSSNRNQQDKEARIEIVSNPGTASLSSSLIAQGNMHAAVQSGGVAAAPVNLKTSDPQSKLSIPAAGRFSKPIVAREGLANMKLHENEMKEATQLKSESSTHTGFLAVVTTTTFDFLRGAFCGLQLPNDIISVNSPLNAGGEASSKYAESHSKVGDDSFVAANVIDCLDGANLGCMIREPSNSNEESAGWLSSALFFADEACVAQEPMHSNIFDPIVKELHALVETEESSYTMQSSPKVVRSDREKTRKESKEKGKSKIKQPASLPVTKQPSHYCRTPTNLDEAWQNRSIHSSAEESRSAHSRASSPTSNTRKNAGTFSSETKLPVPCNLPKHPSLKEVSSPRSRSSRSGSSARGGAGAIVAGQQRGIIMNLKAPPPKERTGLRKLFRRRRCEA